MGEISYRQALKKRNAVFLLWYFGMKYAICSQILRLSMLWYQGDINHSKSPVSSI